MIVVFDIETSPIAEGKLTFKLGALKILGQKKTEFYYTKEDLWNRILELGERCYKRNCVLNVYAHNISFDFYNIVPLPLSNLKFYCHKPFIGSYNKYGREIIKFLDSKSLFRMALKELGNLLAFPKGNTPLDLLARDANTYSDKEWELLRTYCEQDVLVVEKAIVYLKDLMKKDKIGVKRLYTINQIGINHLVNVCRRVNARHVLADMIKGVTWRTFHRDMLFGAYRGGRNEAWRMGEYYGVNYVDCNSLYPFALASMPFPDLRSEKKIVDPLRYIEKTDLFNFLGVSTCLVFNKSDELGLLPVRTPVGNYYPKKGTYLYGTWTHFELLEALKRGYEVYYVKESVIYETASNPFTHEMERLYKLREKGGFEKYFYKQLMNAGIGKFAQHRNGMEIEVVDIENVQGYLDKNYQIVHGIDMNMVVEKTDSVSFGDKPYFAPIIPTFVNAYARVYMYQFFKKIPLSALIYTDTDSCMFMGDYFSVFPLGSELGEFKVEVKNGFHKSYGKKTYRINDIIKIGGVRNDYVTPADFDSGIILSSKMNTLASTTDLSKLGTFDFNVENIYEREDKLNAILEKFSEQEFFCDDKLAVDDKVLSVLQRFI